MYCFAKICCLCLKYDLNLYKLENLDQNGLSNIDKLILFLPRYENLVKKGIPGYLCKKCKKRLNKFIKFREYCINSYNLINTYVTQLEHCPKNYNVNLPETLNQNLEIKEEIIEENNGVLITPKSKNLTNISPQDVISENNQNILAPDVVLCRKRTRPCNKISYNEDYDSDALYSDAEICWARKRKPKAHKSDLKEKLTPLDQSVPPENERNATEIPTTSVSTENFDKITQIPVENKTSNCPQNEEIQGNSVEGSNDAGGSKKQLWNCAICFQSFKSCYVLSKHFMNYMDLEKKSCKICDKAFEQIVDLKRHIYVHSKIKKTKVSTSKSVAIASKSEIIVAKPETASKPERTASKTALNSKTVSKPETVSTPETVSKPETVSTPETVSKPEIVSKPETTASKPKTKPIPKDPSDRENIVLESSPPEISLPEENRSVKKYLTSKTAVFDPEIKSKDDSPKRQSVIQGPKKTFTDGTVSSDLETFESHKTNLTTSEQKGIQIPEAPSIQKSESEANPFPDLEILDIHSIADPKKRDTYEKMKFALPEITIKSECSSVSDYQFHLSDDYEDTVILGSLDQENDFSDDSISSSSDLNGVTSKRTLDRNELDPENLRLCPVPPKLPENSPNISLPDILIPKVLSPSPSAHNSDSKPPIALSSNTLTLEEKKCYLNQLELGTTNLGLCQVDTTTNKTSVPNIKLSENSVKLAPEKKLNDSRNIKRNGWVEERLLKISLNKTEVDDFLKNKQQKMKKPSRKIHEKENNICTYCNKLFSTKRLLNTHTKYNHSNIKK